LDLLPYRDFAHQQRAGAPVYHGTVPARDGSCPCDFEASPAAAPAAFIHERKDPSSCLGILERSAFCSAFCRRLFIKGPLDTRRCNHQSPASLPCLPCPRPGTCHPSSTEMNHHLFSSEEPPKRTGLATPGPAWARAQCSMCSATRAVAPGNSCLPVRPCGMCGTTSSDGCHWGYATPDAFLEAVPCHGDWLP
jgi:hypothetical protein